MNGGPQTAVPGRDVDVRPQEHCARPVRAPSKTLKTVDVTVYKRTLPTNVSDETRVFSTSGVSPT